ncbi:DUF1835 domain-containing protein [Kiloniella sp. b19]|uniref:DUF1835 domain-containing protein n=1 Tax=Kiloniella sp. GXU_MW_B19 TaxID=3141326 RepID=UPI0031D727BC
MSEEKVLHIRCGNDIEQTLGEAGFDGDFLEFSDPVFLGPVRPDKQLRNKNNSDSFLRTRAEFLGTALGFPVGETYEKLEEQNRGLSKVHDYDKIILWFEHDCYDQMILICLLSWFYGRYKVWQKLHLLSIDHFEGIEHFKGFGQLNPAQLASLKGQEKKLNLKQLSVAFHSWTAYCNGELDRLWTLVHEQEPCALPFLPAALQRALEDRPWTSDGLSRTQRLILQSLADNDTLKTPVELFGQLSGGTNEILHLGDAMFWPMLFSLTQGDRPAIHPVEGYAPLEMAADHNLLKTVELRLTEFGQQLLSGEAYWPNGDSLNLNDWHWDEQAEQPVPAIDSSLKH